ncbi:hypothetical protein QO198_03340 [Pseudoalteromonas distincta]|uniref:hypothetical protein n=1 Tax=Pseudoalteromonas distincta TaxID=77608 RepID=UPI00352C5129
MTIKVIIHIGPPKTGTSAIQFSLQRDSKRLAENGIYYPKHTTDINGISSGNLNSIYENTSSGRVVSNAKVVALLAECKKRGLHTLLLSSEFFFERVSDITEVLPDAHFIAYIRNPLDSFESLYNQSVKRHHKISPIKSLPKLPQLYLNKLDELVSKFGVGRFILRSYSNKAFVGGNIINDFYSILNIEPPIMGKANINTSYSFEALEFKRWINQFCSPDLALKVDKILQTFKSSSNSFSLIDPDNYELYRSHAIDALGSFCSKYSVYGFESLLNEVSSTDQKDYREQNLDVSEFTKVAEYINNQAPEVYKSICYALYLSSYQPCFNDKYGQVFIKKYQLSEVSDKYMFKTKSLNFIKRLFGKAIEPEQLPINQSAPDDINRLRLKLGLAESISDVDILKELAFIAETNKDIGLAYLFMKRAQKLRPNGPLINSKIKIYEREIDSSTAKRDDF